MTAEAWAARWRAITSNDGWSDKPIEPVDYAPHCAACVDEGGGYRWSSAAEYSNVYLMLWRDWVGLAVVAGIVGLFVAHEVRDIKLCEALARQSDAAFFGCPPGWTQVRPRLCVLTGGLASWVANAGGLAGHHAY